MTEEELLKQIREGTAKEIESPSMGFLTYSFMHTFLLLKILDKLEDINVNLNDVNSNVIDVENAIDTLNPLYK